MKFIQVLGPGCPKCAKTEQIVRQAVAQSGVEAHVEKVSDLNMIAALGVFVTPGVLVDGQVKVSGRVPKAEEVVQWLQ
ncbi:MAG: thioredoxin family protein [Deltaproteobacteria bacterium]|nr:thioredoxin family protein [Deltaproteobacteria bacterium]